MPKEPALLGKMFEVVITSTGKHFLKGQVLEESLVQVSLRPQPLPAGHVSGMQAWKARQTSGEHKQSEKEGGVWGGFDMWLLTLAAVAVALALLFRILS